MVKKKHEEVRMRSVIMDRIIKGFIFIAFIYTVAAVISFTVYLSAAPRGWPAAFGVCVIVVQPYIWLYVALHLSSEKTSQVVAAVATGLTIFMAFYFYRGFFACDNTECEMFYIVAPAFQAPLALVALGYSFWGRIRITGR